MCTVHCYSHTTATDRYPTILYLHTVTLSTITTYHHPPTICLTQGSYQELCDWHIKRHVWIERGLTYHDRIQVHHGPTKWLVACDLTSNERATHIEQVINHTINNQSTSQSLLVLEIESSSSVCHSIIRVQQRLSDLNSLITLAPRVHHSSCTVHRCQHQRSKLVSREHHWTHEISEEEQWSNASQIKALTKWQQTMKCDSAFALLLTMIIVQDHDSDDGINTKQNDFNGRFRRLI